MGRLEAGRKKVIEVRGVSGINSTIGLRKHNLLQSGLIVVPNPQEEYLQFSSMVKLSSSRVFSNSMFAAFSIPRSVSSFFGIPYILVYLEYLNFS